MSHSSSSCRRLGGWILVIAMGATLAIGHAGCSDIGNEAVEDGGTRGDPTDFGSFEPDFGLGDGAFSCGNGLDFKGCPCTAGQKIACYTGPKTTRATGLCKDGVQVCTTSGKEGLDRVFGECVGSTLPSTEQCDGLDHDCTGAADEGCGCTPGETRGCAKEWSSSPPCHAGKQTCGGGGTWGACEGAAGPPPCGGKVIDGEVGSDGGKVIEGEIGSDGGKVLDCSIPAPRLIAPLSTSRATHRKPNLKLALAAGSAGARIEICSDAACTTVIQTIDVTGTSGAPATELPAGVVFWRAFGKNDGKEGCTPSAVWEFSVNARSAPVNTSWGTVLDVNRDGFADLMVGLAQVNPVSFFSGDKSGPPATAVILPDGIGTNAGDVNGDGFGDVMIYDVLKKTIGVHLGSAAGASMTSIATVPSEEGAAAAAGDVNGDGYSDLLVANKTTVSLYLGSASGPSTTAATTLTSTVEGFGASVGNAGDVNGDGFADVIVGTKYTGGFSGGSSGVTAYVYHGSAAGLGTIAAVTLSVPAPAPSGMRVMGAGDVNGDGFSDVMLTGNAVVGPSAYRTGSSCSMAVRRASRRSPRRHSPSAETTRRPISATSRPPPT